MGGQVHNILMDEFKKAHRKMFKNGFVENEYQHQAGNEKQQQQQQTTGNSNENDNETATVTTANKLEVR